MILITGATSGIGEACARAFAALGRDLILIGRRADRLQTLRDELAAVSGREVHGFPLDVRDSRAIAETVSGNEEVFGRTAVLINNAGLAKGAERIQEGDIASWDAMIDTNVKGLLYITHAIMPYLLRNDGAHVVNLGSVAGRWTYPGGNVYCATKFAVRGLTEAMRLDLSGTGVRVTEIAPGMVETEFSEVRFSDRRKAKSVYAGMTPLSAQDVAEAVVWCVQRPRHVNVQELVIYPTDQASPSVVHRKEPKAE